MKREEGRQKGPKRCAVSMAQRMDLIHEVKERAREWRRATSYYIIKLTHRLDWRRERKTLKEEKKKRKKIHYSVRLHEY